MDELLTAMDRTAANLAKLQDVWNRAARFVPTGPCRGSDPEYDNLRRAWKDLLAGLPPIDGWTITDELPDIERVLQTSTGGVRTERVIVQAKHWLKRPVGPTDVADTLTKVKLWPPPVVCKHSVLMISA